MLKIAKALAENSDAIFADEPTCNLDNGSIEYITNTLKYYSGSVVVISHDRYFLDEIVNKIWEIENGKITEYWGNYTQYLEQKEQENRTHIRKYEQYVNEKQRLEKIVDEKLKQAQKVGKRKSQKNTENGGRLAHQKSTGSKEKALHKSAKVAEKRMEELEEIDLTEEEYAIEYMVYQTTKFGVELPEPEIDKHVTATPSYNAWYKFYSNHFKNVLSDEEWHAFQRARENGEDISAYMPTGNWQDLLEKSTQKTLKKQNPKVTL